MSFSVAKVWQSGSTGVDAELLVVVGGIVAVGTVEVSLLTGVSGR